MTHCAIDPFLAQVSTKVDSGIVCEGLSATPSQGGAEPRTLNQRGSLFGFVPLRDGKLSWKEFFPNKMALGKMQDRFYGRVGALYGLSRGEKRGDGEPAKRHKSVAEYKAENIRIQAELDEKTVRPANGLSLSGRVSRLAATMMGGRFDSVY